MVSGYLEESFFIYGLMPQLSRSIASIFFHIMCTLSFASPARVVLMLQSADTLSKTCVTSIRSDVISEHVPQKRYSYTDPVG